MLFIYISYLTLSTTVPNQIKQKKSFLINYIIIIILTAFRSKFQDHANVIYRKTINKPSASKSSASEDNT